MAGLPSKHTFTGQRSDSYINLLWYGSRHYDPELGRFIQPDTIVPLATQGTQAWDRYAYGLNNPSRYTDPTGHIAGLDGGNEDIHYRSFEDKKGRVVYELTYFDEVIYVCETKETETMLAEFVRLAGDYESSVNARSSSGTIFVGSLGVMVFSGMVAMGSAGLLAGVGVGVAVAGAVVAIGSGQQYMDAGNAMVASKNDAKLYFDALKPFSGLDSLNMDDLLPPLPPLPFNQ